jgi:hypothetical protein
MSSMSPDVVSLIMKENRFLARDAVEYANRVPREIFTKDVAKYLTFEFISAQPLLKVLLQLFTCN